MKSVHILLVEDNEGDILLTTEALDDSKIVNNITVIKDGKAAINYFAALSSGAQKPDLVLLDVNLPKKSGHEVLQYIKNHNNFKHIPVIMLTTSSAEQDILTAYREHVNCYITKPIDVTDFIKAVAKIEDFWINIVTIPDKRR
ncbi:response regulator [Mucilaginibacter psychrotolerans]|uniref:Response regulator n=1 Tax=Mucilaginibacter psychrotolerans TaxID=1524096 RepID=A0A4Y8S6T7_9SPHI|nr:response regulator [Mucilaginibacter psychrotolerans]TFF34739.1 response regulator [Mucilaginibacter psychrotolerans]